MREAKTVMIMDGQAPMFEGSFSVLFGWVRYLARCDLRVRKSWTFARTEVVEDPEEAERYFRALVIRIESANSRSP